MKDRELQVQNITPRLLFDLIYRFFILRTTSIIERFFSKFSILLHFIVSVFRRVVSGRFMG